MSSWPEIRDCTPPHHHNLHGFCRPDLKKHDVVHADSENSPAVIQSSFIHFNLAMRDTNWVYFPRPEKNKLCVIQRRPASVLCAWAELSGPARDASESDIIIRESTVGIVHGSRTRTGQDNLIHAGTRFILHVCENRCTSCQCWNYKNNWLIISFWFFHARVGLKLLNCFYLTAVTLYHWSTSPLRVSLLGRFRFYK